MFLVALWQILALLLGTRGAVLHHSARTVLCFRIHVSLFPCFLVSSFSKYKQRVKTTCLWCTTGPVCLPQHFLSLSVNDL